MARSRGPAAVAVPLLFAAVLVWASSRSTWVGYTVVDTLQPGWDAGLAGAAWAGELGPAALALGAAAAAAAAVRGWAARAVGAVVAVVGLGAAVAPALVLAGGPREDRVLLLAGLPPRAQVSGIALHAWAPALALAGALLAVAVAAWVLVRPAAARGLPDRYEAPAARQAAAVSAVEASAVEGSPNSDTTGPGVPLSARLLWDAMDTGRDPTVDGGQGAAPQGGRAGR